MNYGAFDMKCELTIIKVINHIPSYSMALGERLVQTAVHCWGSSVCLWPGDGRYIVKASGKAILLCTVKEVCIYSEMASKPKLIITSNPIAKF